MNKKRVIFLSGIVALTVLFVAAKAFALDIGLPGIININLGGGGSSSSSSSSSNASSSSGISSIGSTINSLIDTVNTVLSNTAGGVNTATSSGTSTVNNVGSVVTQTINPIIASPTSGPLSIGGSSLVSVTTPLVEADVLKQKTPGGLTLAYVGTPVWNTHSTILRATISHDAGTDGAGSLDIGGLSVSPQKIVTVLDGAKDWSSFQTLGIWILPNSTVQRDEIKLVLSKDPTGTDDNKTVLLSLPDLKAGVWQYVTVDLSQCSPDILKSVASYGFSVVASVTHHLFFYPPQLGPGLLHHLHLVLRKGTATVGNTVTAVVQAEDQFDNVLSTGSSVYNGVKNIVFSGGTDNNTVLSAKTGLANATVNNKPLGAKLALNFTNGISDPVTINTPVVPASLALNASDGSVDSTVGDLSLGLSLLGSGTNSNTVVSASAAQSMLSVTPSSATVGSPELVTVTAMDASGALLGVGGDVVVAKVEGSNPATLSLADLANGTYQAVYTPLVAGTDIVSATLNGVAVGKDTDGTSDGRFTVKVASAGSTGGGGSTSSSGGGGGFSGGGASGGALTLSNGTSCPLYMTKYIKLGDKNDPLEVQKLQAFLQRYDFGKSVAITGVYDQKTFAAVKTFQTQYVKNVLSPWNSASATGYVYILTLRQINILDCMRSMNTTNADQVSSMIAMQATTCPYFTATAAKGAKGTEVAKTQQFLKDMKLLDQTAPLGSYGTMTWNAVKIFQATYLKGVAPATGTWGPLTIKKANTLLGCTTS